ncbi:MAG TPA: adenosine deaminase [Vicinamibacteria bacterium]|nr:adenosine deaminase [Vicinamibacteria bacterium]
MNATQTIARMPKAELHLHLEGTIGPETLWAIAQRNHVALPVGSLEELRRLYAFDGFDRFLDLWMAMCRCFRTEADYAQMVDAFLEDCRRQNIRYVEAHFTPYNHERFGFGARRALEIVTRRLEAAERDGGPVVRLITDIPSESVPESGPFTVQLLEEEAHPLIVAIGLGGPEEGFPRRLVEEHFERARAAGYAVVAHAGETGGAAHVREAVERLKARRIQHGVRAVDDPETLALLAARGICCDVCLTSNTFLTIYRDLASHPLPRMLAAGVPVTLGTDDPPFFATDLNREYARAHTELGLPLATLWQLNLNGLRYGLADTALRRRLMKEFREAGRALGLEP